MLGALPFRDEASISRCAIVTAIALLCIPRAVIIWLATAGSVPPYLYCSVFCALRMGWVDVPLEDMTNIVQVACRCVCWARLRFYSYDVCLPVAALLRAALVLHLKLQYSAE